MIMKALEVVQKASGVLLLQGVWFNPWHPVVLPNISREPPPGGKTLKAGRREVSKHQWAWHQNKLINQMAWPRMPGVCGGEKDRNTETQRDRQTQVSKQDQRKLWSLC